MAKISYKTAALTANGGSNGILTVAATSGFYKGCIVYLAATGLPTVELQIAAILSGTQLAVKLATSPSARYDSSGYTTALSATITQPDQEVFDSSSVDLMRGKATVTAGTSNVTVPNSNSRSSSYIKAWVQQATGDATLFRVDRVDPQDGQFKVYCNANATADVTVAWEISNG